MSDLTRQMMTALLRLIGLLGFAASVSSCNFYFSHFRLVNGSDSQVLGLIVSDGRKTWKLGDLNRGQQVNFSGHLSGEGGPSILWVWRGKRFSGSGCYYTEGMPAKGTITIAGDKLLYHCG